MAYKSSKYSSKDDCDELQSLTEKLSQDLRKHIRQLNNYPILSDGWLEMAETFGRIATISDMESKLAASKDEGTLWETEEQALRFLLEDGKLNLCLRNLVDFKQQQRLSRLAGNLGPILDYALECDKFEKGIGVVLNNAWNHVEALQTTDLHTLVIHIAEVLQGSLQCQSVIQNLCTNGDIHQRQEILIFHYLGSILKHLDDIKEERVMPLIREKRILINSVIFLNLYFSDIPQANLMKATESLSLIVDTDDFKTFKEQYINGPSDARVMEENATIARLYR
eukprot:gene20131-26138_t